MSVCSMSIEELLKYKGSSPCPKDIDAFWDEQVKIVHEMDDNLIIEKADFHAKGMEAFDCWFTGVEGAKVYFKYIRPEGTSNNKVLLMFHGYSCNGGEWAGLLPYAYQGYAVAALDCRGQGGKSEDKGGVKGNTLNGHIYRGAAEWDPTKLYFRNVYLDTAQMAKIVGNMPENCDKDMTATGASQGGGLTLACASLVPNVTKSAPIYPFLSDYRYCFNNIETNEAFGELKNYFRWFDPTHKTEDKFFELLGYIDIQNMVHRIKGDVCVTVGKEDVIVSAVSQFAAYNKIKANKHYVMFHDYGHEYLNGNGDIQFDYIVHNKKH